MPKPKSSEKLRPDIQALRALAVGSVLVFHVFPEVLPGGYVGVDIFFVISGFLITGLLWRQVDSTGKINFSDFWARRARRLLPASLLVAFVSLATAFFLVPKQVFSRFVEDAIAATFYVENWKLIANSANYMKDTASPSAYQHFWSLSVEEQYYILWPILLFLAIVSYRAIKAKLHSVVVVMLGLITVSSFAYSVWLTANAPTQAYFSTFTRAWEFALGALLAVVTVRGSEILKGIAYYLGLALCFYALFAFTVKTEFPSFWAAVPVIGAALMLWGGQSQKVSQSILAFAPIQFIGNISYSLYLWHWPVLVLFPWIVPGGSEVVNGLVIIATSICLAWLSKRFVEDPVRFGALAKLKPLRQISFALILMLFVAGSSFSMHKARANELVALSADRPTYELETPPETFNHPGCLVTKVKDNFTSCDGGVKNGKFRVALIGDSHVRQYWDVLENMAFQYDWSLTLISKSACPLQDAETYSVTNTDPTCKSWNKKLNAYLAKTEPFDMVINSNASFYTAGNAKVSQSYRKLVTREVARGTKWVLIKDNPKPIKDIEACLTAARKEAADKCSISRDEALLPEDALPEAIADLPNVVIVDLTDLFCDSVCKPIIDGKRQYKDFSHISWSASVRVAPAIAEQLPERFRNASY